MIYFSTVNKLYNEIKQPTLLNELLKVFQIEKLETSSKLTFSQLLGIYHFFKNQNELKKQELIKKCIQLLFSEYLLLIDNIKYVDAWSNAISLYSSTTGTQKQEVVNSKKPEVEDLTDLF